MKTLLAIPLIALVSATSLPALAAGEHDMHGSHGAMHSMSEDGYVEGTVKKIDKTAGKVTVAHGPLTNCGGHGRLDSHRGGIS